jgi:Tfp pilus assembly protein PilE
MRFNSQKGITLLEVMLVLTLAAFVMVMSIRMYIGREREANIAALQLEVDQIFLAMGNYYRANCRLDKNNLNPNTMPAASTLIRAVVGTATGSTPSLANFITLPANLTTLPMNPLVTSTSANTDMGYIAQFNSQAPQSVVATSCVILTPGTPATTACSAGATPTTTNAQSLVWQIQVSVDVGSLASVLATRMGADCVSSTNPTLDKNNNTVVYPCSAHQSGTFLVWTRLPSYASPQMQSPLWQTMPLIKQFNQQYTQDPMYQLSGGTNEGGNGDSFYICGG